MTTTDYYIKDETLEELFTGLLLVGTLLEQCYYVFKTKKSDECLAFISLKKKKITPCALCGIPEKTPSVMN